MPNVVDLREWDSQPLNDLADLTGLTLSKSGIADGLMGGMCARSGIGMRPFGLQASFGNEYGPTEGLSKIGTALGLFELHGGAGYNSTVNFPAYGGDKFTQVLVLNYTPNGVAMPGFVFMNGPGFGYSHLIGIRADGTIAVDCNGVADLIVSTVALVKGINVIILTNDRTNLSQKLYINDIDSGSAANGAYVGYTQNYNRVGANTSGATSAGLFYAFSRIINRGEVGHLSLSPTLIFEPEEVLTFFPAAGGGAAALAGNTSNQATSSAALIVSTALASSTASQSTISAALTIINALASSASSQAGSSPALSIGTQLAASTSNAAASTAQLSVPVPLATNASNQALSSATLAYPGAVALSTSVSNNASSSASISIATQLQSQVVAQPSSAAVMSLPVALFANTQSIGIATPALSLQISLSSSTANQSRSSATLTSAPVSALSSVTSNQAISSAMLSLAVALNANTKSNAFSLATITIGSPAPPSPHTENVWRMRARGTVFRMRERSTVWRARE